jgi:hypothetical protein
MWHTTCKVQIDDIPSARQYHMVERQANNVTGGGEVGVPAQQV